MHDELNKGLNIDKGMFYIVLGDGGRMKVSDMIRKCFNMDDFDTSCRKVELCDHHYLIALLYDLYK